MSRSKEQPKREKNVNTEQKQKRNRKFELVLIFIPVHIITKTRENQKNPEPPPRGESKESTTRITERVYTGRIKSLRITSGSLRRITRVHKEPLTPLHAIL
ncbi:hypothetical protein C2G38_562001 [Gigaspora rosea]|uniref:Uncharacterized protein n=1 Tax=Gigaspora rosea TaxID=44941 RepID=A0A397U831_9GLOM|nr:hypothetical protein C2G38_562001 [Gigaspora rosea]